MAMMSDFLRVIYVLVGILDLFCLIIIGWYIWDELNHRRISIDAIVLMVLFTIFGLGILYELCGGQL